MSIPFTKMHGIGNDFVVLDLRHGLTLPSTDVIARMGDRHRGIGFDQLLTLEAPTNKKAVLRYRIWNRDGSSAGQCGNGARCVALLAATELNTIIGDTFELEAPHQQLTVTRIATHEFRIDMGEPNFAPDAIGLNVSTQNHVYSFNHNSRPYEFGAVSMGNPHAVIVTDDLDKVDAEGLANALQNSELFSDGVNVGFAQVCTRAHVRLRVVERGVGETLACGSGACAAMAVLRSRNLIDAEVQVQLPGGELCISWPGIDAEIAMSGPATLVFQGEWQS